MNCEMQLKLQACLDQELPPKEARRIADWIAGNPEAQALSAELRLTHDLLAGNDPAVPVPESREFYWSKIHREILRLEHRPAPTPPSTWRTIRRWILAPASGLALAAILTIALIKGLHPPPQPAEDSPGYLTEVETLSDDIGSYSFQSRSENVFVVWIYDKEPTLPTDSESYSAHDTVIQ